MVLYRCRSSRYSALATGKDYVLRVGITFLMHRPFVSIVLGLLRVVTSGREYFFARVLHFYFVAHRGGVCFGGSMLLDFIWAQNLRSFCVDQLLHVLLNNALLFRRVSLLCRLTSRRPSDSRVFSPGWTSLDDLDLFLRVFEVLQIIHLP